MIWRRSLCPSVGGQRAWAQRDRQALATSVAPRYTWMKMRTLLSRRPRLAARSVAAVGVVAAVHFVVWISAFRTVFMALDAGRSFPVSVELALGLLLNVLGAPLMFLLYLPTSSLGAATPSWVDDTSFIIGLAASNSLLWGCIVVGTYRFLRTRREIRPGAPNKT